MLERFLLTLVVLFKVHQSSAACSAGVLSGLSALYHATNGPNWDANDDWMDFSLDPCEDSIWEGLTPDGGILTKLHLGTNDLEGTLPTEIGLLVDLTYMRMSKNTLTGTIPTELGMLSEVKYLRFDTNYGLSGRVPCWLGTMTKFDGANNFDFKFGNTALCGTIPAEVAAMSGGNKFDFTSTDIGTPCGDPSQEPTPLPSQLPTPSPTPLPSPKPTSQPTLPPSPLPTLRPSPSPTAIPTWIPTPLPTLKPTPLPTPQPTPLPTLQPTPLPTPRPTPLPTLKPTPSPTPQPTPLPTPQPTPLPTPRPTPLPTPRPTPSPTPQPTPLPTLKPTPLPTLKPTPLPTSQPTPSPSPLPTNIPTPRPTPFPTPTPTPVPTHIPTPLPTPIPTPQPSPSPTPVPTMTPLPTSLPTLVPSPEPTATPEPSDIPTPIPTPLPTYVPSAVPTYTPSPKPTPVPTSVPTSLPTLSLLPSEVPTPLPTLPPSPLPTLTPSQEPTGLPTLPPSPLPTLPPSELPTPLPTLPPSQLPTLPPSPAPTAVPSFAPTALPTITCGNGTYYDPITLTCPICTIGRYSFVMGAPYPNNCSLCPIGHYNIIQGAKACIACDVGKLSSADRSSCKDCSAGQYNYNSIACVDCPKGTYAPTAQDGVCITCFAGDHTNNRTGATTCSSCDSGKYSDDLAVDCILCNNGTYSTSRSASCTSCERGKYASRMGSSTCTSCQSGRYQANTSALSCVVCPKGKFQASSGIYYCNDCAAGKYSSSTESQGCTSCSVGLDSYEGSVACVLADVNYYIEEIIDLGVDTNATAKECPRNCYCAGGLRAPVPDRGYWVPRKSWDYVGDIYRCPRATCNLAKNRQNESCFDQWHYNTDDDADDDLTGRCASANVLCTEGAYGPICGSCEVGYIFRGETRTCEPCKDAQVSGFAVAALAVLFFVVLAAVFLGRFDLPMLRESMMIRYMRNIDSGSLKVVWVTYQIMASTSFNLDIQYPAPYSSVLGALNFFSLDFLSLECYQKSEARYFTTVYLYSIAPLVMCLVLMVGSSIALFGVLMMGGGHKAAHKVKSQAVWYFLGLTYVVLPPVSMKQLQSLDCVHFSHDGSAYLRVDTAIDCQSSRYYSFRNTIIGFIILYQMIPILWFYMLWRVRGALNPPVSDADSKLAIYVRDKNQDLAPLRFLFDSYRCDRWWFEVAEMYRRIAFVSVIPLTSSVTATRASLGCVLAMISMLYYREERPFRTKFTNFIAYVAQAAILFTFYAALSIETGVMVDFGLKDLGMGIFLMVTSASILGLALVLGGSRLIEERDEKKKKHLKAVHVEWAVGFSASKFQTTFEAIHHGVVPASHSLVFHYTSMHGAKKCLKSGIPAHSSHVGVLVTFRRPHELTESDIELFNKAASFPPYPNSLRSRPFECVLALSLPSRLLHTVLGKEDDPCLRFIPANLIVAMRPVTFSAVVEPTPWVDRVVLLPPSTIVRAYQLIDFKDLATGPAPDAPLNGHGNILSKAAHAVGEAAYKAEKAVEHAAHEAAQSASKRASALAHHHHHRAAEEDDHDLLVEEGLGLEGGSSLKKQVPKRSRSKAEEAELKRSKRNAGMTSLLDDDEEDHHFAEGILHTDDDAIVTADIVQPKFKSKLAQFAAMGKKVIEDNKEKASGAKPILRRTLSVSEQVAFVFGGSKFVPQNDGVNLERVANVDEYCMKMKELRIKAATMNKMIVYHYTLPSIVPSILRGGLRMSTQGQGDGGVYFSTLGPCSYGMGGEQHIENGSLDLYEDALIKDCFGVERLEEYKAQGKLEAVLVYAIPVGCLQPAPGGRDNAMVVSKNTFQDLSLPDHEGNFFLDPGGILGAFLVSPAMPPQCSKQTKALAEDEHISDLKIQLAIRKAKLAQAANVDRATEAAIAVGGNASAATLDIVQARSSRVSVELVEEDFIGMDSETTVKLPPKSPKRPTKSLFSAAAGGSKVTTSGGAANGGGSGRLSKLGVAALGGSPPLNNLSVSVGGDVELSGVKGSWKEGDGAHPSTPQSPSRSDPERAGAELDFVPGKTPMLSPKPKPKSISSPRTSKSGKGLGKGERTLAPKLSLVLDPPTIDCIDPSSPKGSFM